MKIKGKKLEPPKPRDVVFPREPEEDSLHFKVQAVLDYDEFEKKCPEPEPPMTRKPGDTQAQPNWDSPQYVKLWAEWSTRQRGWMLLKALSATSDMVFETMSLDDPKSCSQDAFKKELIESGLLPREVNLLIREIHRANAMDESHMEEARKRFLSRSAEESKAQPST